MLGAQVRSMVQYRASFAIDLTTQTVFSVLDIVAVLVIFRVTPSLGGFSLEQVLLVSALSATGFAAADLLVGNVERLRHYVRTGLLDAVLIRPLSALGQLLVLDFAPRRFGRVLFTGGLLATVLAVSDIDWTPARVLLLAITPVAATVFFSSVFVLTACVAFWWIDSGEFANSLTYGGRYFTSYPLTVFDGLFRRVFGFALGFGFVGYYPALGILGVPDPLGMPSYFVWGGPVVAGVAALLAGIGWRTGLRHYKGAGS
ncbi:MAG: ABC transporter permease [Catenulispora sp.]|nr:ABC transporter permease [Catenulispora sp.]